jgi:hypothetical protein
MSFRPRSLRASLQGTSKGEAVCVYPYGTVEDAQLPSTFYSMVQALPVYISIMPLWLPTTMYIYMLISLDLDLKALV